MFSRRRAVWPEERVLAHRVSAVRDIAEGLALARTAFERADARHSDLTRALGRMVIAWPARRYRMLVVSVLGLALIAAILVLPITPSAQANPLAAVVIAAGAAAASHLAGRLLRQWRARGSARNRALARAGGIAALLASGAGATAAAWCIASPLASLVALVAAATIAGLAWRAHDPDPIFAAAEVRRTRAAALLCEAEARYEGNIAAARIAFERLLSSAASRSRDSVARRSFEDEGEEAPIAGVRRNGDEFPSA